MINNNLADIIFLASVDTDLIAVEQSKIQIVIQHQPGRIMNRPLIPQNRSKFAF